MLPIPGMLIAYDETGAVVATLDYKAEHDEDGYPLGLVHFAAHEEAGGALTDIWTVERAAGSGSWPEWLGGRAHEFQVELEPEWSRSTDRAMRAGHRIRALVHRNSGHRRERASIEAAISERIAAAGGAAADVRLLVGGPDRPIVLEADGRADRRPRRAPSGRLPLVGIRPAG